MTPEQAFENGLIDREQLAGAQAQALAQRMIMEQEIENRRQVVRFAAILCTCSPWHDRENPHPAAGCMVHGNVMVTLDGETL